MCPGEYNPISKWVLAMERDQGAVKKGQKRTAFEYATEFQEKKREYGSGIQSERKMLIFEDCHIV